MSSRIHVSQASCKAKQQQVRPLTRNHQPLKRPFCLVCSSIKNPTDNSDVVRGVWREVAEGFSSARKPPASARHLLSLAAMPPVPSAHKRARKLVWFYRKQKIHRKMNGAIQTTK